MEHRKCTSTCQVSRIQSFLWEFSPQRQFNPVLQSQWQRTTSRRSRKRCTRRGRAALRVSLLTSITMAFHFGLNPRMIQKVSNMFCHPYAEVLTVDRSSQLEQVAQIWVLAQVSFLAFLEPFTQAVIVNFTSHRQPLPTHDIRTLLSILSRYYCILASSKPRTRPLSPSPSQALLP